ncbi:MULTISPECIES: cell division protein FtsQ/DivIB [Streptomyces]|uniref:Cell division protein FtsQ n=1 Tax=Streptomyces lasiicapitis TaxID=1923961 RepID=A0ABQ2MF73_9ACTN|nr:MULTISPECIES: FtsQ-type POTRA domain-containing protein [Streptomyces]QIB46285.1 FtsQ-type POTRA domain-containing protein [Streptomyces aureoverticillatus]GGO50685.1 cell division protein FtsQ [Streptomyces lasiicapitis]
MTGRAGPTTAERRGAAKSGPPRPRSRRPRLLRPRVLIALVAALAVLAGGGAWVVYGSPWLRAEKVTTSGTMVLKPHEVRAAADVPLGGPLISVDSAAIEERLLRKLPRIDSVDVVRSWPHGIALKVTERTPVLLMKKGGKFIEVDAKGVRFATVEKAPKGTPLLEMATGTAGSAAASLRRFDAPRLRREAVRVVAALPGAASSQTRTVKVRSYDSISLELRGGRTVMWGSGEKGRAKAQALAALMKAVPKARHFDVSVPTAPASSGS